MRISWKCSAHLALFLASSVMVSPFLPFTGLEGALFFPDSVLVISYSLFMSLLPAAVSASSVRSCMKLLLSILVLFLTCLFNSLYLACFCCRSSVWFMSFFSCFLSLMRVQVLAVSHSLCCLVFFPRTLLHVAFQMLLRPCHVSSTDSSGWWASLLNGFTVHICRHQPLFCLSSCVRCICGMACLLGLCRLSA